MNALYLTDEQLAFITKPLTQPAARIKFLRESGFHVIVRPDGTPTVSVANYERVTNGAAVSVAGGPSSGTIIPMVPNEALFRAKRNGQKAQR